MGTGRGGNPETNSRSVPNGTIRVWALFRDPETHGRGAAQRRHWLARQTKDCRRGGVDENAELASLDGGSIATLNTQSVPGSTPGGSAVEAG